jgi:hypothetical protein
LWYNVLYGHVIQDESDRDLQALDGHAQAGIRHAIDWSVATGGIVVGGLGWARYRCPHCR